MNSQTLVVLNFDELASFDDGSLYRYMVHCFQTIKQLRFPKNVRYDHYKVTRDPQRITIDLFLDIHEKQTQRHVFQFGIDQPEATGFVPQCFDDSVPLWAQQPHSTAQGVGTGFRNFDNYRIRILFFLGGIDMLPALSKSHGN